ncbi:hypothetical protein HNY73_021831 [Argiope bruennichi]|uniref:Uncharacterized protein n=1 Tax=Argiope bruennichi TaxID=94029 RepID=A0A8T0DZS4_ARGBR|nr:hypothetical protein HNY73_021831 [Argiope bruennichi]
MLFSNENEDKLAKEARNLNIDDYNVSIQDANAIAKSKLREKSIPMKQLICNINADRSTTKTIARLRTNHHRGMKIDREGRKVYKKCDNCPDTQLTPCHSFECPAMSVNQGEMGVLPSLIEQYDDNIK